MSDGCGSFLDLGLALLGLMLTLFFFLGKICASLSPSPSFDSDSTSTTVAAAGGKVLIPGGESQESTPPAIKDPQVADKDHKV